MFKWAVTAVQPNPDFTLLITFAKGKKRLFESKIIRGESMKQMSITEVKDNFDSSEKK